ncbi:PAS domain S-box protein [Methanoculleus sp. FWC-SCC1]|uniref:histidine kinase n=1 Tax=Methanoculleus frigidifontis TaxID=2584085 RepID=A0ABT8MB75_9EURY|nr:PAS domain S-box protein [Methanoculleus sp. FWC-SCC1]MDN7025192.1 PAS domain S-box protein [Methanoculleus sp. FWC-SCC1]
MLHYRKDAFILYSVLGLIIFTILIAELGMFFLSGGMYLFLAHLFYFPVIFAAFQYPQRGILLSASCAVAYLALVYGLALPDTQVLIAATMQFYVFVSLGVGISVISGNLKVQEMMYRNVFDHAGSAICLIDERTGAVIEANRECTWMGAGAAPWDARSLDEILPNTEERQALLDRLRRGEDVSGYEARCTFPDQTERNLVISANLLPNNVIIMTLEDITERKQDEASLRESERHFRELADLLPQPVFEIGGDGCFTFANRSAFAAFGYSPEDLHRGVHVLQTVVPGDRERAKEGIARLMREERPYSAEYTALRKDGSTFPVLIASSCVRRDGRAQGILGTITDISERKRIEVLDQKHMQNLEFLSRTATEFVEMTPTIDIYGYISDRLLEFVPGSSNVIASIDDASRILEVRAIAGSPGFRHAMEELRDLREDGLGFAVPSWAIEAMRTGELSEIPGGLQECTFGQVSPEVCRCLEEATGGGPIYGVGFTWNGRLYADAVIYLPEGHDLDDPAVLTAFIHQASIALQRRSVEVELRDREEQYRTLFDNSSDGVLLLTDAIVDCNGRVLELLGYTREELLGKTFAEISPEVQPDGRRSVERAQELVFEARAGSPQHVFWQHRRSDGTLIDTEVSLKALSLHGQTVLLAAMHDVTDRLRAEKAIQQANTKLQLLSSITRHDILNQITGIVGYMELLGESLPAGAEAQDYYRRIMELTRTIQRQITFTRDYEDMGVKAPLWQRIEAVVSAATESLNPAGVAVAIDTGSAEIFADSMLEKAFFNLIENSVRHGGHATEIRVTFTVRDGKGILRISDNGAGIPVAAKERIFQRGYGKNTGYGLFLVREILSITGMTIREAGAEGDGACFEIVVPEGVWRYA